MKITVMSSGIINHPKVSVEITDEASAYELLEAFVSLLVPLGFMQETARDAVIGLGEEYEEAQQDKGL